MSAARTKDAAARPAATRKAPAAPRRAATAAAKNRRAAARPGASVRVLERAIDLLECLEHNRAPMGVRAIESATGVPKATSQRLLDVFDRRGYVQKDEGRYALAPGTVRLARSYLAGDSLVSVAMPVLQGLAALSGETCGLYVRQGFDRILVQQAASAHPLRHNTPIGERLPLHLGASGQVLCAGMLDELRERYFSSIAPARLASGQLLRKKDLHGRCEQAQLRGYAIAIDERFEGITAVAAPVAQGTRGIIAAINIAGPSSRMAERLQQLSIDVRNAAREISDKLSRL